VEGAAGVATRADVGRSGLGMVLEGCAAPVPGRQRPGQLAGLDDADVAGAQRTAPLDQPQVPACEGLGVLDHHHQVLVEARMLVAHLGVLALEQQPQPVPRGWVVGELKADQHPVVGQPVALQKCGAPGPQDHVGAGGGRRQLQPPHPPVADCLQHPPQLPARSG
jgi:hypothetical protein